MTSPLRERGACVSRAAPYTNTARVHAGIQRLVRLSKRGVSIRPRKSLFSTAKYRPEFPAKGFTVLDAARAWAIGFVRWYEHRHSGIRYVSSAQPHAGDDRAILATRHAPNATASSRRIRRASGFGL